MRLGVAVGLVVFMVQMVDSLVPTMLQQQHALSRSSSSFSCVFPRARLQLTSAPPSKRSSTRRTQLKSSTSSLSAISSNEELLPGIEAINGAVDELHEKLEAIRNQPYFRLYSVDILASCEYMPQEIFECYSETCEIYPINEEEIPEDIRSVDAAEHEFEIDGWARWDMPSEDYYDVDQFPEGYTGYDGSEVWNFIHNRICFEGYQYDDDHWKADFNKAVSGLHSMISAQIIRGIRERNEAGEDFTDDEVWRDHNEEFQRRLGHNGETTLAIENLYFTFMLLLTAISEAKSRLIEECGYEKSCISDELLPVLDSPLLEDPTVGVASRKLQEHAIKDASGDSSGGGLWEARMRMRDLERIMNCVQCNKCRLHGKISMMGLSTAFQVIVGRSGRGGNPERVHRVELASLMATLYKCSSAIKLCREMLK